MKFPTKIVEREPLHKIPKKYSSAVGGIIVAHSRLELLLTETVYSLLRIDYTLGRQLLRGDNTPETFNIIARLIPLWDIAFTPSENIKSLREEIHKAYKMRNVVGHGAWIKYRKNDYRLRLARDVRDTDVGALDRRIMPDFAKIGIGKLRSDAKFIISVSLRVSALLKQIRVALKPWPEIDPARHPKRPRAPHKRRS